MNAVALFLLFIIQLLTLSEAQFGFGYYPFMDPFMMGYPYMGMGMGYGGGGLGSILGGVLGAVDGALMGLGEGAMMGSFFG